MKTRLTSSALVAAGLLLAYGSPWGASAQEAEAISQGAAVWGAQCVRCHTPRPASEYTDRQWATVILHMRVTANLTREEARSVTAFLQATNAPAGEQADAGPVVESEGDDRAEPGPDLDDPGVKEQDSVWSSFLRYLDRLRSSP